nr:MAG: protein of unknown function DUF4494 [Bacteriophage sp.]
MYFESVVNYWTDNPDGFKPPRIQVKRHLLVRGYTYTEAEAVSIEWGTKETEEEIKISPIKELSIYTVIEDDSAGKFFKVDVLYPEETPKGKIRIQKVSLMVQSASDVEAIEVVKKYFDFLPTRDELVIKAVTLTEIEEYLKIDE